MKPHRLLCCLLLSLVLTASPEVFAQSNAQQLNVDGIAKAIGKEGDLTGGMYKVSFPRSDLTVKAGNVVIKPALALVNWAAFIKSDSNAITYGDLVLLDDEINPAISKLEDNGIELSALHNHLLHENPRVMYIHFVGRGDDLAGEIEGIIGYLGSMAGGVFHINVPRNDIHVAAMGAAIPGYMGMNTPLNFQLEGNNAAINGDFILRPAEVNPVIKVLRANGIEIASVHNHMLDEEPRLIFMHFWAYGDAINLAKGLKAALGQVGT